MSSLFANAFSGKRVLVTGATGFKGSWLCCWLHQLGAHVTGFSLDIPTTPSHFEMLNLPIDDIRGDIRNLGEIDNAITEQKPDIIFHMAAQPLVRLSYEQPCATFDTNVMGTVNVLQAARKRDRLKAIVVITSDKCYENTGKSDGYVEADPMGGFDPYSASKGCAELVAASYIRSFDDLPPAATARAGNVIGGGDWSQDRLIPDAVRAFAKSQPLLIRSPQATRPWQHVLEPLSGYLLLAQNLLEQNPNARGSWNFGPPATDTVTVQQVLETLGNTLPLQIHTCSATNIPHEASTLLLDSSKAQSALSWTPVWNLEQTVQMTADWYLAAAKGQLLTMGQVDAYIACARAKGLVWAS